MCVVLFSTRDSAESWQLGRVRLAGRVQLAGMEFAKSPTKRSVRRHAVKRSTKTFQEQTPFAPNGSRRPVVGLWVVFVTMIVFAAISLLMMFAARVPAVANSINDILGVARGAKPDRPDRSTHLFMLLFCYSSPVLLLICVSAMRKLANLKSLNRDRNEENGEESPFSAQD